MTYQIPSTKTVRELLKKMKQSDLETLSKQCDVPLPTLNKIRYGVTINPGLETVRKIFDAPIAQSYVRGETAIVALTTEPRANTEG